MALMRKHVDHPLFIFYVPYFSGIHRLYLRRTAPQSRPRIRPADPFLDFRGFPMDWISIIPNKLGITLNQITNHIKSSIFSYIMYA